MGNRDRRPVFLPLQLPSAQVAAALSGRVPGGGQRGRGSRLAAPEGDSGEGSVGCWRDPERGGLWPSPSTALSPPAAVRPRRDMGWGRCLRLPRGLSPKSPHLPQLPFPVGEGGILLGEVLKEINEMIRHFFFCFLTITSSFLNNR